MLKAELEKEQNSSIKKIGEYLLKRSLSDSSVATSIQKENKSLKECFHFIKNKAHDLATNGCACIDDETVFGWAVHYYDEDNIKIETAPLPKVEEEKRIVPIPKEKVKYKKDNVISTQLNLFEV